MATSGDVCLPINLDVFVLNAAVCESGATRIAPITQPNYVSLRLDNSQIKVSTLADNFTPLNSIARCIAADRSPWNPAGRLEPAHIYHAKRGICGH